MEDGLSNATEIVDPDRDPPEKNNFYSYYNFQNYLDIERTIAVLYFSFTTLTTIGLGDFNPKSNLERLIMAVVFMAGVAVFSILMDNFLNSVKSFRKISAENEESERLSKFLNLLIKYNKG